MRASALLGSPHSQMGLAADAKTVLFAVYRVEQFQTGRGLVASVGPALGEIG